MLKLILCAYFGLLRNTFFNFKHSEKPSVHQIWQDLKEKFMLIQSLILFKCAGYNNFFFFLQVWKLMLSSFFLVTTQIFVMKPSSQWTPRMLDLLPLLQKWREQCPIQTLLPVICQRSSHLLRMQSKMRTELLQCHSIVDTSHFFKCSLYLSWSSSCFRIKKKRSYSNWKITIKNQFWYCPFPPIC